MRSALIVGGGIMGLSAAWGFLRAGWAVRVLDQDPVPNPRGASVDRHRLIRHAYGTDVGYMRMVDDAYRAWDLLWAELGQELHVPTGVLVISSDGGPRFSAGRQALLDDGRALRDLSRSEALALCPALAPGCLAAAYALEAGGVLLADRIVAALAAHLAARGVVFEHAQVADIDPERASVRLAGGSARGGDRLVVAAGPWAPRLVPALARRVTPSRQVLVYLQPPPGVWGGVPMLLDLPSSKEAEQGGFYAVPPVAGTPLKVGDHRFSLAGDAEDLRDVSAEEIESLLALVRPRLRDFDAYRVLGGHACYYDVAPGERFIVEPLGPDTWVMTGFSGHGFKFGPLLGLALPGADATLPRWAAGQASAPAALEAALVS